MAGECGRPDTTCRDRLPHGDRMQLSGRRTSGEAMKAQNINPEMLKWARVTAGLSTFDAAKKLSFLKKLAKDRAKVRLQAMEYGADYPTRNQLYEMAAAYRRPVSAFYLNSPPRDADLGQDFRRPPSGIPKRENALLNALLREIKVRQEIVKDLLEDDEDVQDLPFVGSASLSGSVQAVADSISERLEFDHRRIDLRKGDCDQLFRKLRQRSEAAGVFVLLASGPGSYHTALGAEIFRGFAISDRRAPFVVVNDRDARPARSFTLLHELAHIWLNASGVSGSVSADEPESQPHRIERFCNDVAGEILLPDDALKHDTQLPLASDDQQEILVKICNAAHSWAVSESVVAYRFHRKGVLNKQMYRRLSEGYAARWHNARRNPQGSAIDPVVVRRHKLGKALLDLARRSLRDESLSHSKAARLLGVKIGSVAQLLRWPEGRNTSTSVTA